MSNVKPAPRPEFVLRGHAWEVQAIAFHPDDHLLYTGYASLLCTCMRVQANNTNNNTNNTSGTLRGIALCGVPRTGGKSRISNSTSGCCCFSVSTQHIILTIHIAQVACAISGGTGVGMHKDKHGISVDQVWLTVDHVSHVLLHACAALVGSMCTSKVCL